MESKVLRLLWEEHNCLNELPQQNNGYDRLYKMRTEKVMNVSEFNFELPQELIAQDPLEDRSA